MGNEDPEVVLDHERNEDKTMVHRITPIEPTGASRSAALICISGRSIGQMFLLGKEETTIGRAPECDIFIDDEGVSLQHAKVIRQEEQIIVMDLGSTNG